MYYIGVDLGGTTIKAGLLNSDYEIIKKVVIPTGAERSSEEVLRDMAMLCREIMQEHNLTEEDVHSIGIGSPGIASPIEGIIHYASNLNFNEVNVRNEIQKYINLPVYVENDANCAALAEHFAGGAKGSKISLCLTIGTGIGGAIIINNEVYHGAFGSGGEVGYMNMMGSTFQKLGASSVLVKKVAEMKNIDEKDINGKYIFDKAKDGDPDCIKAIEELTEVLGEGIANICYIINPEVVVLGGGIMAQREYLYDKIRSSMDKNLIPFIGDKTRLEFAVNENKAGMLGAYFNFINMQKKR